MTAAELDLADVDLVCLAVPVPRACRRRSSSIADRLPADARRPAC